MTRNINKNIESILDEKSFFADVKLATEELFTKYYKITKIQSKPTNTSQATILPSGEALKPELAAGCIHDIVRTTKFLRGISSAIIDQLQTKKSIKILYAGTGPFASLLLPLLELYNPDRIKLTFIDYHQESIDALKELVNHFEYESFVEEYFTGDALDFPTDGKKFDIIICETMRNALHGEPQVAITLALSELLYEDGILIPEEIKLTAILTDISVELSSYRNRFKNFLLSLLKRNTQLRRINLGPFFSLNKEAYKDIKLNTNQFHLTKIKVPERIGKRGDLIIGTEIVIYKDVILSEEDNSGLTKISFYENLEFLHGGETISFSYFIGSHPKVVAELSH